MQLQEIFDQLSSGEFSQLSIGGAEAGVIDDTNFKNVIGHVNLALIALYRRFNLKQNQLTLELQAGQTKYKLSKAFALQNDASAAPVKYLIDTEDDPFEDDLIKVEKVVDFDGEELPLNDPASEWSVMTPSALVLEVPEDLLPGGEAELEVPQLFITYRASHPKIVLASGFDPSAVEVALPDTHLEALLYYVASRVNNPVGMTNEFHAGNSYFAKYENSCQELEGKGLQVDQGQTNTRATRNGWV